MDLVILSVLNLSGTRPSFHFFVLHSISILTHESQSNRFPSYTDYYKMFCLRNYWSPTFTLRRQVLASGHTQKFNSVVVSLIQLHMVVAIQRVLFILIPFCYPVQQVCGARGPRPRYPRVWKTRKKIGTISKSQKLVQCVRFFYISVL